MMSPKLVCSKTLGNILSLALIEKPAAIDQSQGAFVRTQPGANRQTGATIISNCTTTENSHATVRIKRVPRLWRRVNIKCNR